METMTLDRSTFMQTPAEQLQMLRACMLREIRYSSVLKHVAESLHSMEALLPEKQRADTHHLIKEIHDALDVDSASHFEHIFEMMHGGYLQRLAHDYPELTPTELRLSAFLRLPMPSKDVARLFSCSVRSVEKHRERMRKKFKLYPADNLTTFLAARL
jgi:DNA-binding CsgD family transcriptional regulator